MVIRKYCDLLSIKLPYTQKNARRTRKKVKDLIAKKVLIAGKLTTINQVISILKKPIDRRGERDADSLMPILNEFPVKINGQPLSENEMRSLAKYCSYVGPV